MKTTSEILQEMLLRGMRVDKFKFLDATKSTCLAQRIKELKDFGWFIRSRSIEGKGALREYWLDKDEITRIKTGLNNHSSKEEKPQEKAENALKSDSRHIDKSTPSSEQIGLGLPWQ